MPSPSETSNDDAALLHLESLYQEGACEDLSMEPELLDLMDKDIIHTDFKLKSSFHPYWAKSNHIPAFYEVVLDEIKKICHKWHHNNKLDCEAPKEAIKKLKDRDNIIIRQMDKGGGLVIQDREAYLAKALRLLGDNATYEKLSGDPLPGYITTLELLLDGARKDGMITKSKY